LLRQLLDKANPARPFFLEVSQPNTPTTAAAANHQPTRTRERLGTDAALAANCLAFFFASGM